MATVLLFQNPKHLQIPETMLDADALLRQPAVGPALVFSQRESPPKGLSQLGALAFLERRPRGADLGKTLIAAVGDTVRRGLPVSIATHEQGEVMLPAFAEEGADYLRRIAVTENLTLQRVLLLLPSVISPLFFWGRCIGVSVTSMRILSGVCCTDRRIFFPGRRKRPSLIREVSTARTIFQVYDSLIR